MVAPGIHPAWRLPWKPGTRRHAMHALPSCRTAKTGDLGKWSVFNISHFPNGWSIVSTPKRKNCVLKKKLSQTKGKKIHPPPQKTKKNWDLLLKNAKRFLNISHRICRCQHTQSTRAYRWHGAGCPWEPSRQLHPNPSTTNHESNLLWPQQIHRCLAINAGFRFLWTSYIYTIYVYK